MSHPMVKSGWLQRQKYFTKKWKLYWFVLYKNGSFRYFTNQHASSQKDDIYMPTECTTIKIGNQVHAKPHEQLSSDFLISVETRSGKTWILSGESLDDTVAWQMALLQAQRTATTQVLQHPVRYVNPHYSTNATAVHYQYVDPYRTVIYPSHRYHQVAYVPNYTTVTPTYYPGSTAIVYPPHHPYAHPEHHVYYSGHRRYH